MDGEHLRFTHDLSRNTFDCICQGTWNFGGPNTILPSRLTMTFGTESNFSFDSRAHARHAAMTVRALVTVFGFCEIDAREAVREMLDRFAEKYLRDWLLHEGPLNLAAVIAKRHPTELTKKPLSERLPAYFEEVKKFEAEALEDYNANVRKPAIQARIRERAQGLWEREGRPEGRADDHWVRAEAEVVAEEKAETDPAQPHRPNEPDPH
jgi:hypothetical protein